MIVVDSSSIISLAVNCMCSLMEYFNVGFAITPKVYEEIISRPAGNRRFALESMRIRRLVSSGTLLVESPKTNLSEDILNAANKVYSIRGRRLNIIHPAESEVIALGKEISAKALLIDERTTRLLIEDPNSLRELLSYRNRADVDIDDAMLGKLRRLLPNMPIIRSAEIVAVAYEKGFLARMHGVEDTSVLYAALSALKLSGCAITWDEVEEYQRAVI